MKLCGPSSHFAVSTPFTTYSRPLTLTFYRQESKRKDIKLEDEDPDALEALLRHMYKLS